MNVVPPSSRIFFNGGPKKAFSLSLDVKCDQQTHEKGCLQLWHQSQEIYPTNPHNNSDSVPWWGIPPSDCGCFFFFSCWVYWFPHKIEAVFCWVQGGFYGSGLWKVKMLWVQVMGVTLVFGPRTLLARASAWASVGKRSKLLTRILVIISLREWNPEHPWSKSLGRLSEPAKHQLCVKLH